MNMNLHLKFVDSKGRTVKEVNLLQTPTDDSIEVIGQNESFEAVRDRYLGWVREKSIRFDWNILRREQELIQNAIDEYGDDYIPEWYIV